MTLDTQDEAWGLASGYFASQLRGKANFCYGETYTIKEPISKESDMVGYFVFVPSFLKKEDYTIELPDNTIFLSGLYPLYREEVDLFRKIGLERFWHLDGFDMYDVKRENLAKKYKF